MSGGRPAIMGRLERGPTVNDIRVTVESLAHGGDGVARLPDGRTVFVPGSCPADELTVRITEDRPRYARASIVSIDTASPDRVDAPCPYYGTCGGCDWQHVSYAAQLRAKSRALHDALSHIAGLSDPIVDSCIASPDALGYRNRIELSASESPSGLVLGFMRHGTADLLPIDDCPLLQGKNRRLPKSLAGALRFAARRGANGITRVTVRVSSSGETAIALWTPPGPLPRAAVSSLVTEATGARSVTRIIYKGPIERRAVTHVEALAGPPVWRERLGDDRYVVSAPSFFQVNSKTAGLLRDRALAACDADGTMRVGDLYAGVGTFTLPLARAAGEVVAVESSRYALADLRANLDAADLDADIVPGDAAHALGELGHLDAAVIDPPRSGLSDETMRALVSARIHRIVYVSCDPATLARDVRLLGETGYQPLHFTPVDLFPQTHHVETVGVLELA